MKKTTQIINEQIKEYIWSYNQKYDFERSIEYDYYSESGEPLVKYTEYPQVYIYNRQEYFQNEPKNFTKSYTAMRKSLENNACDGMYDAVNHALAGTDFDSELITFMDFGLRI